MSTHSLRPNSFPLYGFVNTPCSKALLVIPGVSTIGIAILPPYYRALLELRWTKIAGGQQLWRLLTNQLVYDSTADLLYGSMMLYYFRAIERKWGSRKYASFLFAVSSISAALHFALYYFGEYKYLGHSERVVGGLYAPLFSLFVYYAQDYSNGESLTAIAISNKIFLHLIAFKLLTSGKNIRNACLIGVISSILYRSNFLWMKTWLRIPNWFSSRFGQVYQYLLGADDDRSEYVVMGATEDIQEDMVFDHLLRNQSTVLQGNGSVRQRVGQGYADVLQPAPAVFHDLFEPTQGPSQFNNQRIRERSVPEDKIQKLVEMGFPREAVVDALSTTNSDVQEATSLLLSQ